MISQLVSSTWGSLLFKPRVRLSAVSVEAALDPLSPSISAPPLLVHTRALSLSKKNVYIHIYVYIYTHIYIKKNNYPERHSQQGESPFSRDSHVMILVGPGPQEFRRFQVVLMHRQGGEPQCEEGSNGQVWFFISWGT